MKAFQTIPSPANRLVVFARVPERGRVKTRLMRALEPDRTLEIYEAMVNDLLRSIGDGGNDFYPEVLWTGSPHVSGSALRTHFGGYPLAQQTGESLGDRLALAFTERIFFHETRKIVTIGTDDPHIPRALIENAFHLLDCCDWVAGPALDGGYYLIGCRGASFDVEVFEGIDWGTATVLAATERRIRDRGQTMALLPARRDIDEIEDLEAYAQDVPSNSRMAAVFRDWGWTA